MEFAKSVNDFQFGDGNEESRGVVRRDRLYKRSEIAFRLLHEATMPEVLKEVKQKVEHLYHSVR